MGKQRVECYQILKALADPSYGWQNHPAVNMWRGYEIPLTFYGMAICTEWSKRGYKDSCKEKIMSLALNNFSASREYRPPWLTEQFASNHRSILLGKAIEKRQETGIKLKYDFSGKFAVLQKDKFWKQHSKSIQIVKWYQSHGWTEQPAEKVNNKWPYIWPEMER